MDQAKFLGLVKEQAAFRTDAELHAAVRATLTGLGAALVEDERRSIAEALPPSLRPFLAHEEPNPEMTVSEVFEHIREHEGVTRGLAVEHAQAVCSALQRVFSDDLMRRLARHAPDLVQAMFRKREPVPPPETIERAGKVVSKSRTLDASRPGSRHPVSESRPERDHSHSIASHDDPHGDTRLSSARGLTQEHESETLAAGEPPKPDRLELRVAALACCSLSRPLRSPSSAISSPG